MWLASLNSSYKLQITNGKIVNSYIVNTLKISNEKTIYKNICCENENDNENDNENENYNASDLICPICYENRVTVQTNCEHNFCYKCIKSYYENIENDNFDKCPYCRTQLCKFYKIYYIEKNENVSKKFKTE